VLRSITFCGVFALWRRPCRGTRALPCPARLRWPVVVCVRIGEPWAAAHGCCDRLRFVAFLRCGGVPAAHTRALPCPARLWPVCRVYVLLAIGELCGVIRRAVGGSPRVSGFFACVCVFVDWRHPCRRTHAHTRALPCPARLARGGDLFDVNAGPDVRNWHFLSPAAGHPRLRCA
jgi:hypothetical protein